MNPENTHTDESLSTWELVMSHMWMHLGTHLPKNMSHMKLRHTRMSHVTHVNELCVTSHLHAHTHTDSHKWVTFHVRVDHVTHMSASWNTFEKKCHMRNHGTHEWVMSHMWINRVSHHIYTHRERKRETRTDEWLCTWVWVMSQMWMCDMCAHCKHVNVWHVCAFTCVTHIWMSGMSCMCDTHVNMWHVTHVTHVNGPWHTSKWVMSHLWMGFSFFFPAVMPHLKSSVAHTNESCPTFEWHMRHIHKSLTQMSHCQHETESCPTCGKKNVTCPQKIYTDESLSMWDWVVSHMWMSPSTFTHKWKCKWIKWETESCHTCEWAPAHSHINGLSVSLSHVTRVNEPWRIHQGSFTHTWSTHVNVSRHVHA